MEDLISQVHFRAMTQPRQIGVNRPNYSPSLPSHYLLVCSYYNSCTIYQHAGNIRVAQLCAKALNVVPHPRTCLPVQMASSYATRKLASRQFGPRFDGCWQYSGLSPRKSRYRNVAPEADRANSHIPRTPFLRTWPQRVGMLRSRGEVTLLLNASAVQTASQ